MESNLPPGNTPPPFSAPQPPPPANRPPPIMSPTGLRPAPRKSGTVWMVMAIVFVILLVFSVLLNFKQMVGRAMTPRMTVYQSRTGGPRLEELVIRDHDSVNKIAVVPVEGVISGDDGESGGYSMVSLIKGDMKRAQQ